MPLLDDLAAILTAAGVGPVQLGGGLLSAPDAAVALLETAGLPPVRGMGTGVSHTIQELAGVQVFVRDAEYEPARLLAVAALNALDNVGPAVINGTRYDDVRALQRPPFCVGLDQNLRTLFSFNLIVTRAVTT